MAASATASGITAATARSAGTRAKRSTTLSTASLFLAAPTASRCLLAFIFVGHLLQYSRITVSQEFADKKTLNNIAAKEQAHYTCSRNQCHKSATFFRPRFLVRASRKSGTGLVRYQIPAMIRTRFHSKPESSAHMAHKTEMMTYDWPITVYIFMFICYYYYYYH